MASILLFRILGMGGWQLIAVAIILLLLFGANRIPSIMRNLGKGVHSFKQGIEDAKEEMNREVRRAGEPEKDAKSDNKTAKDE